MSTNTICAVITSFNRLSLLQENIRCLKNQTTPVDGIIVINNGSTDGTLEWLRTQEPFIKVLQEDKNIGASAAFSQVIQLAYELEYDWIWIMDDDAFPTKECLQNLISSKYFSDGHDVALAPIVIENEVIAHGHRGIVDISNDNMIIQAKISNDFYKSDMKEIEVSFISFVGLMVGKNVIKKIGYPDGKYFIFNDDLEYSMRINKSDFKMYMIKDAVMFHRFPVEYEKRDIPAIFNSLSDVQTSKKLTDKIRDKIAFSRLFNDVSDRTIYFYIGRRNLLYTLIKYKGLNWKLWVFMLKNFFDALFGIIFSKTSKLTLFRILYHAYKQALTGKFDTQKLLSYRKV
jgi:rhamnopyranosyl-N-acetylglucosaminyl-diphospho-decaprenol beta-1,3/1,4-galactofuranosyltransferase